MPKVTVTITTAGGQNQTWALPANCYGAMVYGRGAGGGGGGTTSTTGGRAGGGGGAEASVQYNGLPGDVLTISLGLGGAGGVGASGASGAGNTTVKNPSATTILSPTAGNGGTLTTGGTAGTTGTGLVFAGAAGGVSSLGVITGGGGGGSGGRGIAPTNSNEGRNWSCWRRRRTWLLPDGATGGSPGRPHRRNGKQCNRSGPAGGGGGAAVVSGSSTGGNGGDGEVVIIYSVSDPNWVDPRYSERILAAAAVGI